MATLALFGPGPAAQLPQAAPLGGFATNDDGADSNFVNDFGQTPGDVFQQNAQTQN